jgi:nucleoside-diphosphate-sugar epimerase
VIAAPTLCITGAQGFIGRHLLRYPAIRSVGEIRCLVRDRTISSDLHSVKIVIGDIRDEAALTRWLTPGAVVVDLAFDPDATTDDSVAAAVSLGKACTRARAQRLVHLSTAMVVGRNPARVIDESISCQPQCPYEWAKLRVEQALLNETPNTQLVILRPTAVFGAGGKNLVKLARETATESALLRYLRSCVHARRPLNLVSVENVTAAITYFALDPQTHDRNVFIVSDDEAGTNNYQDVERALIRAFGRAAYVPRVVPMPPTLYRSLRLLAGRSGGNTNRRYSSDKLLGTGFVKPLTFDAAIGRYAGYLASQFRERGVVLG